MSMATCPLEEIPGRACRHRPGLDGLVRHALTEAEAHELTEHRAASIPIEEEHDGRPWRAVAYVMARGNALCPCGVGWARRKS